MSKNNDIDNSTLAYITAKNAMKVVIFIGMCSVILLMLNIYIAYNQIVASAEMNRKIKVIEQAINIDSIDSTNNPSER